MKTTDPNNKRKVKIQYLILILCLAALAQVLWLNQQTTLTVTMPCRLRVLDETGKPVPNLAVTHSWGRSLDWSGSEKKLTDANGVADFPAIIITLSRWERFKLKWAPATVWGWYPHRDEFPITISLPVDFEAVFDPTGWQIIRPGDPSCFTNRQGVFVRYSGAFVMSQVPQVRNKILGMDPHRNTVGLGIPPQISDVTVHVRNIEREQAAQ